MQKAWLQFRSSKRQFKALWHPHWYDLDQSLKVGIEDTFLFYALIPEGLRRHLSSDILNQFDAVFYAGPDDASKFHRVHSEIISIYHAELGMVEVVESNGFDYTIVCTNGDRFCVNAEEMPGTTWKEATASWVASPVADWNMCVVLKATAKETLNLLDAEELDAEEQEE